MPTDIQEQIERRRGRGRDRGSDDSAASAEDRIGVLNMKLEPLYFDGCPSCSQVCKTSFCFEENELDASVELVRVADDEDAA